MGNTTEEENRFFESHFILETLPPRSSNPEKYLDFCKSAVGSGAQVIAVTDLPMGSARVSPIAPAHMLVENNIEVLMHFSRTTRNAIRIEGDLIATHMLGIKNILLLSGDDPRVGTYPFSSSVEDFSIYDVFKLTKLLNEKNEDLAGLKIYGTFSFNSGGVFSPFEKDVNQTLERMGLKIQNGCNFFVSQPIFNKEIILSFLDKAQELLNKTKIYIALMCFESIKQLEYFSKVPGVFVPKEYFKQKDDSHLEQYSIHRCISIIEELSKYVNGFYLTSTTKNLETIKVIADVVASQY
ncbi:methylenetetrahydrofolate reductase [Fervidobacterium sp.]